MFHTFARACLRCDAHIDASSQPLWLRAHRWHSPIVLARAPTVAFLSLLSQPLHNPCFFPSNRSDTSSVFPRSYLRISIGWHRCLRRKYRCFPPFRSIRLDWKPFVFDRPGIEPVWFSLGLEERFPWKGRSNRRRRVDGRREEIQSHTPRQQNRLD